MLKTSISDDIYFDGANDKAYKLALKLDIIDLKLQLLLNKIVPTSGEKK